MRLVLLSLLLLTGCASENSGVAAVRLGAQDEGSCKHMTVGEGERAYQQCVQKAMEYRQEEAKAQEAKAQQAKAAQEEKTDQAEKTEGFGDRLQSAAAALFNIGR
jgi:hypothetical protein